MILQRNMKRKRKNLIVIGPRKAAATENTKITVRRRSEVRVRPDTARKPRPVSARVESYFSVQSLVFSTSAGDELHD